MTTATFEAAQFKLQELEAKPVLASSGKDDLRIDDGRRRVWLSRRSYSDGAAYLNEVREEALDRGRWSVIARYAACTGEVSCTCPDCVCF